MIDTVFNKDNIDVEEINKAIFDSRLVIMPCESSYDGPCYVTEIKKHNRKRKDGKARYILTHVKYVESDPCYCGFACVCDGGTQSYENSTDPLTPVEISELFYFYPQYKVQLDIE